MTNDSIVISGIAKGYDSVPVTLNGILIDSISVSTSDTFEVTVSLTATYNNLKFGDGSSSVYKLVIVDNIGPKIESYLQNESIFKDTSITISGWAYDVVGAGIYDIVIILNNILNKLKYIKGDTCQRIYFSF